MLMPELIPEFGSCTSTAQRLTSAGLGPQVLTMAPEGRAIAREHARRRLIALAGSAPKTRIPVLGRSARAQDRFFEVQRLPGEDPEVFLLSFLLAHIDAMGDAEAWGSTVDAADWDALRAGVAAVFATAHSPGLTPQPQGGFRGSNQVAQNRWRIGHRLFFALTQGLISALVRLARAVAEQDSAAGSEALSNATTLSLSAAVSLRYTADFSESTYHETVRPAMMPPHVPPGFSGIQGHDHHILVALYRAMRTALASLDPLRYPVDGFRAATEVMFAAHLHVCAAFGGRVHPSLLMQAHATADGHSSATEVLAALIRRRRALLEGTP